MTGDTFETLTSLDILLPHAVVSTRRRVGLWAVRVAQQVAVGDHHRDGHQKDAPKNRDEKQYRRRVTSAARELLFVTQRHHFFFITFISSSSSHWSFFLSFFSKNTKKTLLSKF